MRTQIMILTKLELCNLYGLNALRFSKDRGARRKSLGMLAVWGLLLIMMAFYMGGLTYGLVCLGLEEAALAYLITICSFLIFFFGMLKEGSVLFRKEGYDILCALPLPRGAIAVSRLLKMYAEYFLLTLAVLLPGVIVYAWNVRPGVPFYLAGILSIWSVPLIPMAAAVLAGTVITGISSRMRHKSLAASALSIIAVVGILYGVSRLSALEGHINPEMLQNLSETVMALLAKIYPPAVWLGTSISRGKIFEAILRAGLSLAVSVAVAATVTLSFRKICQGLHSVTAKHSWQMGELKVDCVLSSLCKREFCRYFSSSIYVTNTIIGPIMGCVLSGGLLAAGPEALKSVWPLPASPVHFIPFTVAGMFCMMPATATSVSMEGKNWWIVKSLPLSAKNILDAKLLMNLLLVLPFYLLSELLLILALRPGPGDLLWLVLIPAVMILFSCVFGIAVNLRFPVLEWESEVRVVKQSASAMLGGMGGFILALLCTLAVGIVPGTYVGYVKTGVCVVIPIATIALYHQNNRFDIREK